MGKSLTYDAGRVPDTYTPHAAMQAALDLAEGNRAPSLKLALLFSVCSTASKLEGSNASMADLLRGYAERPLPSRETVIGWLRASKANWNGQTLAALFTIDALASNGTLDRYSVEPDSYDAWLTWRAELRAMVRGAGYKVVSLAAYLMWPLTCPILCLDRHHLRRLGGRWDPEHVPQSASLYRAAEQELLADWMDLCDDLISPACFAHFLWSWERKAVAAEPADDTAADHTRLNVRVY
jgi:hypothetical protein